ncbi:MAG: hypothetical protein ABIW38_11560 [Ferruginibacter sp.]
MKNLFIFSLLFFNTISASAQNFSGQWKGEFFDKSTKFVGWGGDRCDYVLELECKGKTVTGFSYTYFTDEGKRYYTICRLEGFLDKKTKYLEVKEVERTKTNVPIDLNNCFQVHKLTYAKQNDDEVLEGTWIPAPDQKGSCGFGVTSLVRRNLKSSFPGFKSSTSRTPEKTNWQESKKPMTRVTKPAPAPMAKQNPVKQNTAPLTPNRDSFIVPEIIREPSTKNESITTLAPRLVYEKRNSTVIKTIQLESERVKIDLYDNGEIDGDSISLFLNGKLFMANKRLTEKPITIFLDNDDLKDNNELVMYAENLGTIPPNTALMVVTDGTKRYEVRITSDLQKSGAIRFLKKVNGDKKD